MQKKELTKFLLKYRTPIVSVISSLLVFLFLYASVSKLVTFRVYYGEINGQPLPNWMTPFLVWTIPGAEILIAIGLIVDRTRLIAMYASLIIMSAFAIYIGLILNNAFGRIPCSCGGVLKQLDWKQHLFFNLFFVFISFIGILLLKGKPENTERTSSRAAFT